MLKPGKNLFDEYTTATRKPAEPPRKPQNASKSDSGRLVSKSKEIASGDRIDVLLSEIHSALERASMTLAQELAPIAPKIREIRDGRLYLKYADNFGDFCKWHLGKSKSVIYRWLKEIAISEATGVVPPCTKLPLIENDLRKSEGEIETIELEKTSDKVPRKAKSIKEAKTQPKVLKMSEAFEPNLDDLGSQCADLRERISWAIEAKGNDKEWLEKVQEFIQNG